MAYATIADLSEAVLLEKVTAMVDDEGDGSQVDARLNAALDDASAEIDVYLLSRYDLPLSAPVPPILAKCCVDIAVYALYSHVQDEVPETRRDRYLDAKRLLEAVRDGKMDLVAVDGDAPEAEQGGVRFYAV